MSSYPIKNKSLTLRSFLHQLFHYKRGASVGDTLEDGSIVLQKSDGLSLIISPEHTEIKCAWSFEFSDVLKKLEEAGLDSLEWFIPTLEQLQFAYDTLPQAFPSVYYWSSTEDTSATAWCKNFAVGTEIKGSKKLPHCVRAFRRIAL
jgi:hypothetical protein